MREEEGQGEEEGEEIATNHSSMIKTVLIMKEIASDLKTVIGLWFKSEILYLFFTHLIMYNHF